MTRPDVVIAGGGVIGLAIAWRCATAGLAVTVCDEAPGRGASWAAAGMLAPVGEVHFGEEALLALNLESARRWPGFAAELEAATGLAVGLRTDGALAVAYDLDDLRALESLADFQQELGLTVERLRGPACRELEPALHPRVRGGVLVAGDHQVDNRRLVVALERAVADAGVDAVAAPVTEVVVAGGRVGGVQLAGGDEIATANVVLAVGCRSGDVVVAGMKPDRKSVV